MLAKNLARKAWTKKASQAKTVAQQSLIIGIRRASTTAMLREQILSIAANEKAITEGKTFDLMYVNPQSDDFNANRIYAFMRSYKDEHLLILANFSDREDNVVVNIPLHAFDYLNIKADDYGATDLISGDDYVIKVTPDAPINLNVPANNAVVLRF